MPAMIADFPERYRGNSSRYLGNRICDWLPRVLVATRHSAHVSNFSDGIPASYADFFNAKQENAFPGRNSQKRRRKTKSPARIPKCCAGIQKVRQEFSIPAQAMQITGPH